MPTIYDLKPRFQNLLRPLVQGAVAAGITPNHLTIAALLGSLAIGAALPLAARRPLLLLILPAWLLARMALNAMDGMAAREHKMKTALGGLLNEIGDVLSDVALYLPLACLTPRLTWPAIAFAFGAVFTEVSGLLAQVTGGTRRYDGPMGKSDRAFVIGAMALVTAFAPALLRWWPYALALAALLTVPTCVNRLRAGLRGREGRP